jgi:hypothetical protein
MVMNKRKKAILARLLVSAVGVLSACGSGGAAAPTDAAGDPTGACASGGGDAHIDWVDFIRLNGITYQSNHYEKGLEGKDIGESVAEVRCKIADAVTDPEYEVRDGDAAYLEPGATIYSVKGYPATFRIASRREGKWMLYEPDTHPEAGTGADLLAIEGRVSHIGVNSVKDGTTELARIEDPAEVERLVEMVMTSPVDQGRNPPDEDFDEQVFVAFYLDDGTRSIRAFWPPSGMLQRGILTPDEFGDAIEKALRQGP